MNIKLERHLFERFHEILLPDGVHREQDLMDRRIDRQMDGQKKQQEEYLRVLEALNALLVDVDLPLIEKMGKDEWWNALTGVIGLKRQTKTRIQDLAAALEARNN